MIICSRLGSEAISGDSSMRCSTSSSPESSSPSWLVAGLAARSSSSPAGASIELNR
jgi:hypothetical protein